MPTKKLKKTTRATKKNCSRAGSKQSRKQK